MKNDTIADMLTRIRNANLARYTIVQIPLTKITRNIAKVLLSEGYINSFEELKSGTQQSMLLISLKYHGEDRKPHISNITRASKSGRRLYSSSKAIPRVLGGFGTLLISTSKGLMTADKAKELGIGGELICYVW